MCTVTWTAVPAGGYTLLFNRDELRTREAERPPARAEQGGVAYVAPIDPQGGGTWLGVNAFGVTVGLLNHYAAEVAAEAARLAADAPEPPSRGRLVTALMACDSVAGVAADAARLVADGSAAYRPFEIIALDASGDRLHATWDGGRLAVARGAAVQPPISSSGYDTAAVLAARAATFTATFGAAREGEALSSGAREATHGSAELSPLVARLLAHHRSHLPERGPYSVCMHRPDARTVSLTMVTVDPAVVAMRYGAGPACTAALGPAVTLVRSTSPSPPSALEAPRP